MAMTVCIGFRQAEHCRRSCFVHLNDLTSIPGIRDFFVVTCERYGPTLQWRICLRALASGLIVWRHGVQEARQPRSRE